MWPQNRGPGTDRSLQEGCFDEVGQNGGWRGCHEEEEALGKAKTREEEAAINRESYFESRSLQGRDF